MTLTRAAVIRLGLSAVILYLIAHGLTGRQGLVSYMGLQEQEHALETEQAELEATIETLSDRAARLRTGSTDFDRDYLEERARTILGAARADEVVIDLPG
ncbi:MAG: septum formation initiator family protein [Alphaproteobacteria bacterium]|nr:septum formation initiator family protein [Alphaproteobacteria bacterium]